TDAKTESHAKDFEPEFEHHPICRAAGREKHGLEDCKPGGKPNREGRKYNVERNREGELESRQDKSRGIHWRPPSRLGPQIRSGEIDEIFSAAIEHGLQHVKRE